MTALNDSKNAAFAITKTKINLKYDIKNTKIYITEENVKMLDEQKQLIQAQHRLEQAQMRNRSQEQKARTRRLIQEGAILEKAFPWVKNVENLNDLEERLCSIARKAE